MRIAFDPEREMVVLRVRIWGPSGETDAELALDTGASSTLIAPGILATVGCEASDADLRVQVTTGSGVISVPRVAVSCLSALGVERTAFTVIAHTLPPSAPVDGVLGLDFMRDQRLTIDFREGWITLDRYGDHTQDTHRSNAV